VFILLFLLLNHFLTKQFITMYVFPEDLKFWV